MGFIVNTLSIFMILFVVIDITGSVPLIIAMLDRGQNYRAGVAGIASLAFFILFFFLGRAILKFLGVDLPSFAVEMIFDIRIFKDDAPTGSVTFVPLVFPLIAGPGAITTLLSLKAMYSDLEILTAVALNMLVVYLVLINVRKVQKLLGTGGIFAMRKFFGIILLAVSVKMLTTNLATIIAQVRDGIAR